MNPLAVWILLDVVTAVVVLVVLVMLVILTDAPVMDHLTEDI